MNIRIRDRITHLKEYAINIFISITKKKKIIDSPLFQFQQKDSPWEGAVRSAAAIWSTSLIRRQRVSNQLIHITDWLPTFANLAGINIKNLDGKNVWSTLSQNKPNPRKDVLCHHDILSPYMSYISGNYKYVNGSTYEGKYDDWLSSTSNSTEENEDFGENYAEHILKSDAGQALYKYSFSNLKQTQVENEIDWQGITSTEIEDLRSSSKVTCEGVTKPPKDSPYYCDPFKSPCLFDLRNDPCEMINLATAKPDILARLEEKVIYYGKIALPPRNKPSDPRADPANYGGIWTWWYDEIRRANSSGKHLTADRFLCSSLLFLIVCTSYSFRILLKPT